MRSSPSEPPGFLEAGRRVPAATREATPQPGEPRSLALLDSATRMLAEARTLPEVRQVLDLAEAARVYAKKHHLGIEAQNHAGVIAVEATIRHGEILAQMAAAVERATPSSQSVLVLSCASQRNDG